MRKPHVIVLSTLTVLALAGTAGAQAPPQGAPAQATPEHLLKMAAEQAEAVERARLKVAEEAARERRARDQEEFDRMMAVTPVDVEIVISRFQGDKKVSSLPYSVSVNATNSSPQPMTRLRMGGRVPLPVMAPSLGPDGKPITGLTGGGPVQYEDVGTTLESTAKPLGDGRFDIYIAVSDSAIAPGTADGAPPVIRTFQSSNNLVLRDGQTRQFTAASDRITGEVVRVDVTLRVVK